MANRLRRSGWLTGLFAGSTWLLSGCATLAGIPLLYADPGVRVERPSKGELPYQPGMTLEAGDIVETAGGSAVIDFDDGNVVALRENTRIQLGSIRLFLGEVFARVSSVVERGGGQVTTDEMSASVKGTEYSVRRAVAPGRADVGSTTVIVRQGTVSCEDRDRRRPPVLVTPNRLFRIEGQQVPRPPQIVDALAATAWADRVIQLLFRPRPSVSWPEITIGVGVGIPTHTGSQPTRDRGSSEHHEGSQGYRSPPSAPSSLTVPSSPPPPPPPRSPPVVR